MPYFPSSSIRMAHGAAIPGLAAVVFAVTLHRGWIPARAAEDAAAAPAAVADADRRIVQTVQRLGKFDYSKASPKTREAIGRWLTAMTGSAEYFAFVEKFAIADQTESLLKVAAENPGTPKAASALKLVLQFGGQAALEKSLAAAGPEAAAALLAGLADVGSHEAADLAWAAVVRAGPGAAALTPEGKAGITAALGRGAAGQQLLLTAAREGRLPEETREAAAAALTTSTDAAVRSAAREIFHMEARKALPPTAELAKRTGDAAKGREAFMSFCFTCHQVDGQGIDFGPALSEIGSKLAREALYDAILNPNAGISFGYEGFEVKTQAGETFIGMVATETADELSLRVPGGVVQKLAKSAISSKTPLGVSLMTPGLETLMSEEQLVDLVEYLAGRKKKE